MTKQKKINYQLSFNERQIYISKVIKIQNMLNEYFLDITKSLETDLPFDSSSIDISILNEIYDLTLTCYSEHIIKRAKALYRG